MNSRMTIAALGLIFGFIHGPCLAQGPLDLSLAKTPLPAGRVVGIEISTSNYSFEEVRIPQGWNMTIDNEPSWICTLKASIFVGAAALDTVGEKPVATLTRGVVEGLPATVKVALYLTTDFSDATRYELPAEAIILTPSGGER